MKIWIVILRPNLQPGRPFIIEVESSMSIYLMKEHLKHKPELGDELTNISISRFVVWKTKGKMILNISEDWEEILENVDFKDRDTVDLVWENNEVGSLGLSDNQILLVEIRPAVDQGTKASLDEFGNSKEFKRYRDTLDEVIYDGLRRWDGSTPTIAPPIQLFHPIFDDFTHTVNDPNVQPTIKDLKSVFDLMVTLAEICRPEEYCVRLCKYSGLILDGHIERESDPDGAKPDGVIMVDRHSIRIPCVFIEMKGEIGEGNGDPSFQVSLAMRRS